jgi:hypothetical protein
MGLLLRRRGDRRARSPRINRRQSKKFIPSADREFAYTAQQFALVIARDLARYHLSAEDSAIITEAVKNFRQALSKALHRFSRTQQTVMEKKAARKKAEEVVRKYGRIIRANPDVSHIDKASVRIFERKKERKQQSCMMTAPYIRYLGAYDRGGPGSIQHVLKFKEEFDSTTSALPNGAERLELFVEWVPQGERIPRSPEEMYGRAWYLRSFTRSRMEVKFPMPPVPMLIVYWGRWADAKGNVGPWSQTVVARVEGWSTQAHDDEVSTGAVGALPDVLHGGKRELANDARFFLAERREVRERYMEGRAALPEGLPDRLPMDLAATIRQLPEQVCEDRPVDTA